MRLYILGGFLTSLMSCSSELNLNQFLAQPFSDNAVDLRSRATTLYDEGKYSEALPYAEDAVELSPSNEEGGVLLGAIHMALAGIDSFQLIENLSSDDGATLEGDSAASSLSSLSAIIGLSEGEYSNLSLENNEKDGVEGAPSTGVFSDLPVLLPKSASEARISGGDTIYHIAQAIQAMCSFVGDEVKLLGDDGDSRHTSESCVSMGDQNLTGRSHFNWAFAHLAEAILFNGVVLYAPSSETPNLQARGTLLGESSTTSDLSSYISAVSELATVTDIIMPTDAEESADSMLQAMFMDLQAASQAFSSLSGLPDSVTGSLESSLSDLQSQRDAISEAGGDSADSTAMKNQLTADLASDVRSQIQAKSDAGSLDSASRDQLCSAYASISSEAFAICD